MNKKQIRNLLGVPAKKFYNFGVVQSGEVDLVIYGEIGYQVDADELVTELKGVEASQINVYINSVGGDAFDGIAIYNALKNHPASIMTCVEGLAASAASVIAMAGDEVQIGKSAFLMIHNASGLVMGESKDMRQVADMLDKLQVGLAQSYASKSGRPVSDFLPLMDAETWFSADDAVAAGLADTITDNDEDPELSEDSLNMYNRVPDRLKRIAAHASKTKPSGPSGKKALRRATAAAATQGAPVNLDDFKAYAAAHPDAVESYIEQGKKVGEAATKAVALQAERDRIKAVADACGDNHALALEGILAGYDASAVKLAAKAAADAAAKVQASANASATALAERDAEIKLLKEQAAFNQGTQSPVATRGNSPAKANANGDESEAETAAKEQWSKMSASEKSEWMDEASFVTLAKLEASGRVKASKVG